MADSVLSITIRDTRRPCAPYQSTQHSFWVQIFNCDGKPLFWKGVNYGVPTPLQEPGAGGGRIHAQFKVPPGCYLVRAIATCKNVITDWGWVDVCCDQTVCVDLVIPSLLHCILRTIDGLSLGTVAPPEAGDAMVAQIMPKEVQEAVEALKKVADRLPRDPQLPEPPGVEEIRKAVEGREKKGQGEDPEQA